MADNKAPLSFEELEPMTRAAADLYNATRRTRFDKGLESRLHTFETVSVEALVPTGEHGLASFPLAFSQLPGSITGPSSRQLLRLLVIRHQLAVYSPISGGPLLHAARSSIRPNPDWSVQLRDLIKEIFHADDAQLLGSGTQALQVAIETAGAQLKSTPVVALPAFTCYDVASAAVGAGFGIRLFDIDPETLGPDLDSLRAVIRSGAQIVVVAPLFGVPIDWDAVTAVAAESGAIVVEDAAQGHGASWRRCPLGSLGSISVLSFGRGKGWTGGAGGAVLVRRGVRIRDSEKYRSEQAGEINLILGTTGQWLLGRPGVYGLPASLPWLHLGETHYREPRHPTAIADFAVALLLASQTAATREAAARREAATWWRERLEQAHGVRLIRTGPEALPGYLRFPIRVARGLTAHQQRTARRFGVARSYPSSLAALEPVQRLMHPAHRNWPGADSLVRELVTLPTHSRMSRRNRERTLELVCAWGGLDAAQIQEGN